MDQLAFDFGPAMPGPVPLADVRWGAYGTVKGWGPDGSRTTRTGYVIGPPRVFTAGVGEKLDRHRGVPLLKFTLLEPPAPGDGGCHVGMYAPVDAVFTPVMPPADRPLKYPRSLACRLPVADLRRGDTFYLWDEDGQPRYHVQADPRRETEGCKVAVLGDRCDVSTWVDGRHRLRTFPWDLWVDVVDPEEEPWQAAPVAELVEISQAARGTEVHIAAQVDEARGYALHALCSEKVRIRNRRDAKRRQVGPGHVATLVTCRECMAAYTAGGA